jgi:hypothetical protein
VAYETAEAATSGDIPETDLTISGAREKRIKATRVPCKACDAIVVSK